MSAPANIPLARRRRRGTVEVYFLLYLSAIILLLGTTQGHHKPEDLDNTIRELLAPGFRVEAEKPALLWRFVPAGVAPDSNAGAALEQDSTNIITAYGTVADLRFDIIEIEDTISGRSLPAEAASLTRVGERSAVFRWQPPAGETMENRVYRVTVSATGRPIPPRDISPAARRQVMAILERGGTVGDSVTFTVNLLSINNTGSGLIVQTPSLRKPEDEALPKPPDTVRIFEPAPLQPVPMPGIEAADVVAQPGQTWTNRVQLNGPPGGAIAWNVASAPTVTITGRSQTGIVVRGVAPASEQRVRVTATRSPDGSVAQYEFTVSPVATDNVRIPLEMFVGEPYSIDLGGTTRDKVELRVMQGTREIDKVVGRSSFEYRPRTAGTFLFIRTINGAEDQYTVKVTNLRAPEVASIDKVSENEVVVTTICYGSVKGVTNSVSLKIQEGNANEPEQIDAQADNSQPTLRYIQKWRVTRESGAEFKFSTYAIDKNGSGTGKSPTVRFPR